jgi:hypothetical protein
LVLPLEDRQMLSTWTVTSTADTVTQGTPTTGTLRWAVEQANFDSTTPTTIAFNLPSGANVITLSNGSLVLSDNVEPTRIDGPGANQLSISGSQKSAVFTVDTGVTASLSGLTVTGGSGSNGGGLDNDGTATLTQCTLSGNSATVDGGAIYNVGNLTLTDCTLSGNSAQHDGGAVDNVGGTASLTDCTISGNLTLTNPNFNHFDGSALFNASNPGRTGTLGLTDCTLSGNTASTSGNALYTASGATTTLVSTIVAGDSGGDTGGSGTLTATNHDLVGGTAAAAGLGSLGDYGGPTQTIPLLPGSEAIGAGPIFGQSDTDQRGFPLPVTTPSDIGAFQTQSALTVNSTSGGTGSPFGDLSLNQAVNLANALSGTETITFGGTVFATPQTIILTADPLLFSDTVGTEAIIGPAAGVTVSGGGTTGVFDVEPGVTLSLSELTITGASTTNGGGLLNDGTATLTQCTLSGNSATVDGGAIYNVGNLTLTDCTISGNLTLTNPNFNHFDGSALFNTNNAGKTGTLTLTSSTISGNTASASGNALYTASGTTTTLVSTIVAGDSGGDTGGSGTLTATNHDLVGGTAASGLGSLGNYGGPTQTIPLLPGSLAIGAGIAVSGTDQRGMPLDSPQPDVGAYQTNPLVVNTTIDGNGSPSGDLSLRQAVNLAGALGGTESITFNATVFATARTITLTASPLVLTAGAPTITGSAAGVAVSGGGTTGVFDVQSGATLSLSDLTITSGIATSGGGVLNSGTVILTDCTISGNSATDGGGLYNFGTAVLSDCTISGNDGDSGGGVGNAGTITLTNCTISGNSAGDGGGLYEHGQGSLVNTIVAGNSEPSGHNDIEGTGTLAGSYNLIGTEGQDYFAAQSDLKNIFLSAQQPPGLGSLGDYGGPTQTIPVLPGSPALDAGTAGTGVPTTDERGEPRFGPTDIGAFESQGFTLVLQPGSTPQATPINQGFANELLVTVVPNLSIEPVAGGTLTFSVPATGASADLASGPVVSFSSLTVAIASNGEAFATALANGTGGSYDVTASVGGTETKAIFALTNQIQPTYSSVNQESFTYGSTAPLTIGGTILAGTTVPPDDVEITLDGVTESAAIGSGGSFSADFDAADLTVSGSPYTISYMYAANGAFLAATDSSKLTVTPAPLTITANSASKLYSVALPAFSVTYSGFVNGDTVASLATKPTLATTATATSSVVAGGYPITAVGAVDSNYTITYVAGTLAVTPAPLIITADSATKVYGAALPSFVATYSGLVNGDTAANLTSPPMLTSTATAASPVAADGYSITVAGAADGNYTIMYAAGTLTVTPAPLTITADSATKVYGTALPAFSPSYTGLVNGDTAASLTTPPMFTTTATAASPVLAGGYPITGAGTTDGNYTITYAAGTLMVTPAPLTIAEDSASKVYGAALPSFVATYSGLVNGDIPASLTSPPTLTTTATAASPVAVGGYPITAAGAVDGNYTITYVAGTLTVTPAPLTIAAGNASKVYGAALPAFSPSYTGLVNGDTAASLTTPPMFTTTATAASPVLAGGYPITGAGTTDGNYTITYVAGTLAVTPSPLMIAADSASKVYGAPLPSFVATYSGFVNGDTAASLATPPMFTTTATAASPVLAGGYPITAAGAVDGNYAITYVAGTLTVTPAPLIITADSASKVYGAPLPSFVATYSGFVNGDTAASLATPPMLTTTATATSTVLAGGYPITAAGAADGNYAIAYVAGTLTVTPATPSLRVSASDGTYDGSPFPASVTVVGSGSANAPAASLEGISPTLLYYVGSGTSGTSLGSTPPSAPGTYTVLASFAGSADYTAVQAAPVTFTIDQGTETVGLTSSAGSAVHGQPVTLTATVSDGVTSGTVTFSEGGTTLGSVALSGSDSASLTTSALGIGSQSITASYSGNADFPGATSGPAGVSIAKDATQVVLVPNAVFKKKKVVSLGLKAEIEPVAPGGGQPSGTVTFEVRKNKKKEMILGTLSLGGGAATLAVKSNSVLKKPITILYSGDADFQASTTALTLTPGSLVSMARPMVSFVRRR